jgi:hypothetical protein
MNKKQLREWQEESVRQAYAELETEILMQYSGFVSYQTPHEN